MTATPLLRRLTVAALSLSAVLACAACAADAPERDVASLDGPAHAPTDTTVPDTSARDDERPQLRLDDRPERFGQLIGEWTTCLLANGATGGEGAGPGAAGPDGSSAIVLDEPVPQTALDACAHKLPRQPPELDPALNPDYRDDFLAMVSCMKKGGMRIHVVEDHSTGQSLLNWTYDDSTSPSDADLSRRCQLEAFG